MCALLYLFVPLLPFGQIKFPPARKNFTSKYRLRLMMRVPDTVTEGMQAAEEEDIAAAKLTSNSKPEEMEAEEPTAAVAEAGQTEEGDNEGIQMFHFF